jgi:hypothetical protein
VTFEPRETEQSLSVESRSVAEIPPQPDGVPLESTGSPGIHDLWWLTRHIRPDKPIQIGESLIDT